MNKLNQQSRKENFRAEAHMQTTYPAAQKSTTVASFILGPMNFKRTYYNDYLETRNTGEYIIFTLLPKCPIKITTDKLFIIKLWGVLFAFMCI